MKLNRKEQNLLNIMNNSIWDLPSPSSMNYFWNFGATLGVTLISQILTGFFLTLHYTSFSEESFSSVVKITREIWFGWMIRFLHMNGASMFFFFTYLHMMRGLFYFSNVNKNLWMSGVTILFMLMGVSFLGYVLPWGQMSFWAVAVITNLLSVIPMIGNEVVQWIWGGFSVSSPTLNRFYSLHFLLPFLILILSILHLYFLHNHGSSNPTGVNSDMDKIKFHPYLTVKDLFFIISFFSIFMTISFYLPFILGDSVNNVPANPMQTPVHIQPEWYFLPSYAILRSLPSKTAGVISLILSIGIFYVLPMYKMKFFPKFKFYRSLMFWLFIGSFMFLMKLGSMPAEEPFTLLSKIGAMIYFSSILMLNL